MNQSGQNSHILYTGSTSVYDQDGGIKVDETLPAKASDPRGEILIRTEATLREWSGTWTILRVAGIYGPGRHYLLNALKAGRREVAGRGNHHLNLIHLEDIVSAVLTVFSQSDRTGGRIFNVADDGRAIKAEVV
ncbi:MAG: NAD-dependent epimerase/dehydratase family protein [Candidatus Synoicihabitans palmerolidicus]|nr:NAD-dependent epimerase/dehydratase family protein [Candidatus Synoicihabitans palmerolidicus]